MKVLNSVGFVKPQMNANEKLVSTTENTEYTENMLVENSVCSVYSVVNNCTPSPSPIWFFRNLPRTYKTTDRR